MNNYRKKIAFLLSSTDIDSEMRYLKGVCSCAFANDADVSVFMSFGGYDLEKRHNTGEYNIYNLPDLTRFDGVILIPNLIAPLATREQILNSIQRSGIPCVSIDYPAEGFYHIITNNRLPIQQLVEHLITVHGARRIAFVNGPEGNTEAAERFYGYRDALEAHGIPLDEKLIIEGGFTMSGGLKAARTILRMVDEGLPLPDALVFSNDDAAVHGAAELIKHGIRIPEDLIVTGYDDTEQAREFSPRLTTVSRPLETIAYHACEKILKAISGTAISRTDSFAAYPIFRESCGCTCYEKETYQQFRFRHFEASTDSLLGSLLISQLNMDLYDCEDFRTYYDKLATHAAQLKCDGFYLCLDSSLESPLHDREFLQTGYATSMSVPVALNQGERIFCPDFPTEELYPDQLGSPDKPELYIFLPLHYLDISFGYLILVDSYEPFQNSHFNSWMMTISNSLENLRKQTLLKTMVADLDSKYVMDSLTGLYNRFGFTRYSRAAVKQAEETGQAINILFFDLDSLKYINDQFGHDEGDFALIQFSRFLEQVFCSGEVICRFGGDEFVVLATGRTEEQLHSCLRQLDFCMEEFCNGSQLPYPIQCSAGFYIRQPEDTCSIDECIILADKKMYAQKQFKKENADSKYFRP